MDLILELLQGIEKSRNVPAVSDVAYKIVEGTLHAEMKRSIQERAGLACMRARGAIEAPRFTEPTNDVSMGLLRETITDPEGRDYIELADLTERLNVAVNAKAQGFEG